MSEYKRLFIDKISKDFDPEKDLVLGPWCLHRNYSINEIKKMGDKGIFLKDGTTDHVKAFKCCEMQHQRSIEEISTYVGKINKNKFSLNFYSDYISYWVISFIHLVHYSERIIQLYLNKYSKEKIEIILFYKSKKVHFENSEDLTSRMISDQNYLCNFILFQLLKKKPQNWKVTYLNNDNSKIIKKSKNGNNSFYSKTIKFINSILAPRIKSVYGFNIFEKILLSFLIFIKKPIKMNNGLISHYSKIKDAETYEVPPIKDEEIIKLAIEFLPSTYKKIYKKKNYFIKPNGKVILCSKPSLLYNDDDRFDLLLFKEKKGNIFSVQHGGNYGEIQLQIGSAELATSKFISWGHKNHENYNIDFKPLPSPQLKIKYKNKSQEDILFVSTVNFYAYPRYVKCQSFQDSVERINDTVSFLNELKNDLVSKINYKIHINQFSEKEILSKKFKSLKFLNGYPEKKINSSKIVILNHYSTLLFKCLAANVPTIIFCKKDCWKLTKKGSEIFDLLNEAEILFYDSKKAGKQLNEYWNNTEDWWRSERVQKARKNFCDEFAIKKDKYLSDWISYLWHLQG